MFLNSLKWRIVERLDELSELSDVELDAKYTGFIDQMRSGKGYIRGGDALGRPISIINARQHHKADQPAETIHRYTLYVSTLEQYWTRRRSCKKLSYLAAIDVGLFSLVLPSATDHGMRPNAFTRGRRNGRCSL